jgi:hypothetical protein
VLRGGQDDEQELSDMMSKMLRLSEDATKNPPLPPLAEAAVRVRNLDSSKSFLRFRAAQNIFSAN